MKLAIVVMGSNAIGKTIATQKALESWVDDPRLKTIYADNSDRRAFKGDTRQVVPMLSKIWNSSVDVMLTEGTGRIALWMAQCRNLNPSERICHIHVLVTTGETMYKHMHDRCVKLNKRYRDDYWTKVKLEYEASKRYPNIIKRHFPGAGVFKWEVGSNYEGLDKFTFELREQVADVIGYPNLDSNSEGGTLYLDPASS